MTPTIGGGCRIRQEHLLQPLFRELPDRFIESLCRTSAGRSLRTVRMETGGSRKLHTSAA